MSKQAYKTTVLKVSIHRAGSSPILDEMATHVSVEDECGGPFLELRQFNDHAQKGVIRVDSEELAAISEAGKELIEGLSK